MVADVEDVSGARGAATHATFAVTLVTPARHWLSTRADKVVAPSALGQVTILPQHVSTLCDLDPGVVAICEGGRCERFFVTGGFLEVENDQVAVLAQDAIRVEDIDVEQVRTELTAAQIDVDAMQPGAPGYAAKWRALTEARARLHAAAPHP